MSKQKSLSNRSNEIKSLHINSLNTENKVFTNKARSGKSSHFPKSKASYYLKSPKMSSEKNFIDPKKNDKLSFLKRQHSLVENFPNDKYYDSSLTKTKKKENLNKDISQKETESLKIYESHSEMLMERTPWEAKSYSISLKSRPQSEKDTN